MKDIYVRYTFEDGDSHAVLLKDDLANEQRQLVALAQATGNFAPLNRWWEKRAEQTAAAAVAMSGAAAARKARKQKSEERHRRIRAIAETNYLLQGEDLIDKVRIVWTDLYPDERPPSKSVIYRALNT